jgi:hypothetical protein
MTSNDLLYNFQLFCAYSMAAVIVVGKTTEFLRDQISHLDAAMLSYGSLCKKVKREGMTPNDIIFVFRKNIINYQVFENENLLFEVNVITKKTVFEKDFLELLKDRPLAEYCSDEANAHHYLIQRYREIFGEVM